MSQKFVYCTRSNSARERKTDSRLDENCLHFTLLYTGNRSALTTLTAKTLTERLLEDLVTFRHWN